MIPSHYVYKKPLVRTLVRAFDVFGTVLAKKRSCKTLQPPQHICLIMLHQIGDVVMCLPTIEAIRAMAPDSSLTIIAGHGPSQLLKNNPYHAKVFNFDATWQKVVRQFSDSKSMTGSKKAFLNLIKQLNPDVAIIFHPDLYVSQLISLTETATTIGFANAGAGFRLTHPVDLPTTGHQVERNYSLAKTFGEIFNFQLPNLKPPHLDAPTTRYRYRNSVVIHPFASAQTKNWIPENWDKVINWLIEHNFTPIVIGGKNDSFPTKDGTVNLCGKLSLTDTVGLISHAKLFIGIDSGPGHIAAAVGTPVISVFSSVNDPSRWQPYSAPDRTIILHQPVEDRVNFPSESRNLKPGVRGNPYIDKITPNNVIEAIKKLQHLFD